MSFHRNMTGDDLHEPATDKILNSTSALIADATWVDVAVLKNDDGFKPVTAVAGSNARVVGFLKNGLAPTDKGVVVRFGEIEADTSGFSVGNELRLANSTTYALATDHTHVIGRVVIAATLGLIQVDTRSIPQAAGTGGSTTLAGDTDVEISGLTDNQIIESDGGIWKNVDQRSVSGTVDDVLVSLNGRVATLSTSLGKVKLTDLKQRDILEYDAANFRFVNKNLPAGLVERLEDLSDVEIIGDEDDKILVARSKSAYFQVDPAAIGDTIYSIDTSDGLMFTKPGGSTPLINSVSVAFALNRSQDITSYLIVDETGGDQLLVEISFVAPSITIEDFIDRIVLALQTDWADGTGTSTERTVNDQMSGNVLVGMNGTWSKAVNPNFVQGGKAAGTSADFSMPEGHPPINDAEAIRWNISGRPNGYLEGVTAAFTGLGNTPTVIELLDAGVSGLNAHSNFNPHYIASRVGNGIRVTALADGSQDNGRMVIEFVDSATGASNASGYISNQGITNLTGGVSGSGQPFSFRWTDSAHKHIIARPTLETGGSGTSTFRQGGFAWIDELPTLNLNSDVKLDNPTDGQYAQFDSNADLVNRNFNQSIESLNNVDTSNVTLPTNFQVLGKVGNNYVAADPLISNSKDIAGTPSEGSILAFDVFDSKWHVVDVPVGSCFAEIGNANISGGGADQANLPLMNFKSDTNLYGTSATQISLLRNGIYKVSAGFSKLITDNAPGSLTTTIDFRVFKNGNIISPSEYRGRETSGFSLSQFLTFTPAIPDASASRFRDFMIVDGAFGDVFTVDYRYSAIGLTGLSMGDGLLGKSWVRIERIG